MAKTDGLVYWVGDKPSRPVAIDVRDSQGRVLNLSTYTDFEVVMLDSDNGEVDLTGSFLTTSGADSGRFVFRFPENRSIFNKAGEYLLQLVIKGANGTEDRTFPHTIRVKKLGGIK